MTTAGKCKLCTLDKELQDSHFIGRAVYKKLNEPAIKNPQPIVITSKGLKQSPVQLRDDLFCSDCEGIFNDGGEAWMHKRIATTSGFPLLDLFKAGQPILHEPDFILYDALTVPGVDCAAVLEYGMGVFFKAAVHTWKFEDGTSSHIDLSSERTEALRKFTHREAGFPDDMVLTVCISSNAKQMLSVLMPIGMGPESGEDERYYFYVNGVYYCLMIGSAIYPTMRSLSFHQSAAKPVFVGDEWADQALAIAKQLSKGAPASPKLREGLKPRP
ncbi:MAG: hypothetical protein WCE61_21560 [Candidatus Acidiferrum sp.]